MIQFQHMENKLKNLTILVNSCDAYKDLWNPFFKLFNVYVGELKNCQIVLNADKEQYTYPGLNIVCPNKYQTIEPWGKRVKNCLKAIKTDYVFWLLDDFFLQNPINIKLFNDTLKYLEQNKNISCFNFISIEGATTESEKYQNYCMMPLKEKYRYNAQAAIWRTKDLNSSILEQESAWDWEIFGNIRNKKIFSDKEIYALKYGIKSPYDYNFIQYDKSSQKKIIVCSPVMRGKWVPEIIDQCFKNNDIKIDYSIRGIYTPPKPVTKHPLILIKKIFKRLFRPFSKKYKELVTNPIKQYKKSKKIKEQ